MQVCGNRTIPLPWRFKSEGMRTLMCVLCFVTG